MKSKYFYVLVFTAGGAVYVTDAIGTDAMWFKAGVPKELGKSRAETIAYGLNMNGYRAVVVGSPNEICNQPYPYEHGEFKWELNEAEKNYLYNKHCETDAEPF